jgi:hypothetical protein
MPASVTNIETVWAARAERVRQSQARTDVRGMTRPVRDADERAFLAASGQLGPFRESGVVIERIRLDLPE